MAEGAIAYEMNSEFAPVLRDRMHYFNTDPRCGGGWGWSHGMGGGVGVGRPVGPRLGLGRAADP